jgi:hypothetical protein
VLFLVKQHNNEFAVFNTSLGPNNFCVLCVRSALQKLVMAHRVLSRIRAK